MAQSLVNSTISPQVNNVTSNALFLWPCQLFLGEVVSWNMVTTAIKVSKITAISINVVTSPFAVLFNAYVVLSVIKNHSFRKERLVALACLAFTDMISGLLCQPFYIAKEIYFLKKTQPNCALEKAFYLSAYVTLSASFPQLLIVTYERYIAIIKPYQYATRITNRRLIYATAAVWVEVILETIFYYNFSFSESVLMYANLGGTFIALVMFAFVIYSYVKIAIVVRRHRRQIAGQQRDMAVNIRVQRDQRLRLQKNSSISIVILIALLITSYIPLYVSYGLVNLYGNQVRKPVFFSFVTMAEALVLLNSFFNPIIYCLRTYEFKQKLWKSFKSRNIEVHPGPARAPFVSSFPRTTDGMTLDK